MSCTGADGQQQALTMHVLEPPCLPLDEVVRITLLTGMQRYDLALKTVVLVVQFCSCFTLPLALAVSDRWCS